MTIRTPDLPRLLRRSTVLLLTLFLLAAAGCDSADTVDPEPPPPTPTTGTISGRISLPAGSNGSTSNTRVAIYQNFDDWENDRVLRQVAAGGDGSYAFDNVNPGSYYFDAWKDNNNNSAIADSGDFFGVLGQNILGGFRPTPQEVRAGENVGFDFQIFIIP